MAGGGTGSDNNPNDLQYNININRYKLSWSGWIDGSYLGFNIAGQRSLRNMKPDTTLVFTYLSLGHFCVTSRCRLAQIYLGMRDDDNDLVVGGEGGYLSVLGQASLDMNIDSVISSRT